MNVHKLIFKYSIFFKKKKRKRMNNEKTLINILLKVLSLYSFIILINYANVPIIYSKHYYKNISKGFDMN
jgi:cytochrome c oxidase assembly protein Cox11